jgi:glycosyltransferase involved in cell wall biosynthesis
MDMNLKIGYIPYSADLSQPADRRRFPHFAKRKNVHYEIADPKKKYDVIILPAPSNLSKWLLYKKKNPTTIFIFEMVDSLIFNVDLFLKLFKGVGRFLMRKDSLIYFNYRKLIIKWIKIADVVICSSTEIKTSILKWNQNVFVSLDYLENEYQSVKNNFEINGKMKLVWEGQGSVLPHFLHFKKLFQQINSFCELHVITSEKYSLSGQFRKRDSKKILSKLPINTIFHEWQMGSKDEILSECDCGIIPLNPKHLFGWHKPANKLISFWFTGLPTIVSDTPAYKELMNEAGNDLYCSTIEDWVKKINLIKNMTPSQRENISKRDRMFVQKNYSDEALDNVWEEIFRYSILQHKK